MITTTRDTRCKHCGAAILPHPAGGWVNVNGSDACMEGDKPGWANRRDIGTTHAPDSPLAPDRKPKVTLDEYARQCREACDREAQGGGQCGEAREIEGEAAFGFCGFHWGPVLDAGEGAP